MTKAVHNPPNPWTSTEVQWLGPPPEAKLQVFEQRARQILSPNTSPDLPFSFSLNPYRGCQHACAYCYARPSHQYLDFGAGTDFDRKIVVKTNAVQRLRARLSSPHWQGKQILFSGNTDCYQPLEANYRLTRGCLEACLDADTPVAVITKAALVRRDIDVLAKLARGPGAHVFISIPFADDRMSLAIEPSVCRPSMRFKVLEALAEAGIPCGVAVAPVIPGLSDEQIPAIIERAAAAGATRAFMVPLRLADEVEPVFIRRLRAAFPLRAERVLNGVRAVRGGALNDPRFGARMTGQGTRMAIIRAMYHRACRQHGLVDGEPVETERAPRENYAAGLAERRERLRGQLPLLG